MTETASGGDDVLDCTYVGHGHRGIVSVARERCPTTHAERIVATKRRRPNAPPNTIRREAEFIAIANRYGIGPHLLGLADDGESVRYEYVKGLPILDHIQQPSVDKEATLAILRQVFAQLLCLDRLRLNKHEMTWPAEHIIIEAAASSSSDHVSGEATMSATKGLQHTTTQSRPEKCRFWRPVLIDFERCTADATKPRNVTQFLQFLATPTVTQLLRNKRIAVDVPRLRKFGSEYKARLAMLEATGSLTDSGPEGSKEVAWDFIGVLGLTDEPTYGPASTAVAAEHRRGRAARKLEAKRMRVESSVRSSDTMTQKSDAHHKLGDGKSEAAPAPGTKDACVQ